MRALTFCRSTTTAIAAVLAVGVTAAVGGTTAHAFSAEDYQSLSRTWKLGYVVGVAHGRALYRAKDGNASEAALDACIPKLSDVGIIDVVDAYLSENPDFSSRPAADVVIEAVSHHCAAQ